MPPLPYKNSPVWNPRATPRVEVRTNSCFRQSDTRCLFGSGDGGGADGGPSGGITRMDEDSFSPFEWRSAGLPLRSVRLLFKVIVGSSWWYHSQVAMTDRGG